MNRYRCLLRPASFCSLPYVTWEYVEIPRSLAGKRPDLPVAKNEHGVIATGRPLTETEQANFDLEEI